MRNSTLRIAILMCALTMLAFGSGDDGWTFRGEIADSQCALNVHSLTRSHQEMLKSKSMGGSSLSCTLYCIRYLGGDFVLTTRKHVYHLDNQDLVMKFAAEKVRINGTLDPKTDTIHINRIEADE